MFRPDKMFRPLNDYLSNLISFLGGIPMCENLHIQVGIKLSKAINESIYPVSTENAAHFVNDMISLKNVEIASIKNAIEFVLNDAPYYLLCDVTVIALEDTISVSVSSDYSEDEDGGYNEWLEMHNLTEEKLSKEMKSYIQLVRRLVNSYSRRFGSCLLSLSIY